MNDTRYGLTAGVYTTDEARAHGAAGARQRRQRVLELLRPRQPAPALVGSGDSGVGADAVALRHPGLHAAAAPGTCASLERRPRRRRRRRAWRCSTWTARCSPATATCCGASSSWTRACSTRGISPRATRDMAARYAAGTVAPRSSPRFYVGTLAGRSAGCNGSRCASASCSDDRAAHSRRGVRAGGRASPRR